MAEAPQAIRGINWRETLPFTHLFRAFRMAIHPSKLVLAFLALFSIYVVGRVLDGLWMQRYRAVPTVLTAAGARHGGEVEAFESRSSEEFARWHESRREELAGRYASLLREMSPDKPGWKMQEGDNAIQAARSREFTKDARYWLTHTYRERQFAAAEQAYATAPRDTAEAKTAAEKARNAAYLDALRRIEAGLSVVRGVEGQGLFDAFMEYETLQINRIWAGVMSWNWMGGLRPVAGAADLDIPGRDGVLISAYRFFAIGPSWALRHHPIYFLIFGTLFLAIWSLFAGAIARIAAVHVADEGRKLSVRQGLAFASSKFLSFLSAPLIPLIILLGIGIAMALVTGLIMLVPYAGEVVIGLLFFVGLAGGFVMTLVLLGTIGGFNLMYPTIAVEGSDSFDAISRSFSYVYAKPWRMLFYTLVALAYGALTYVFVRLFIWLMLVLTHYFMGLLVYRHAAGGLDLWPTMFPPPQWDSLPYTVPAVYLNAGSALGGFLIAIWVHLVVAMLGAFAISMYLSLNTIIYYLMRREVDATEMDDVYLEQPEEDFIESPTVGSYDAPGTSGEAPGAVATAPPMGGEGAPPTSETLPGSSGPA